MGFLTFTPTSGDTDNVLLQKIVQILAAGGGALTMGFLKVLPTSGDTDNVLLQKIVQLLAGPAGSGGGVFIAAVGGSGTGTILTGATFAGTTLFSGCIGSNLSFCPDNTWDIGTPGARPQDVDIASIYKIGGINVVSANNTLFNYFFGNAGNITSTGGALTAVGSNALFSNTSGGNNTALGFQVLFFNTTGVSNTAVGYRALFRNVSGIRNTAVGDSALFNTLGSFNTAIGYGTLELNTTGALNNAIGYRTLAANTTGSNNTASGLQAMLSNTTGTFNTAIGSNALSSSVAGDFNVAVGYQALFDSIAATGTGFNTALGFNTGRGITTGVNNTILGANVTGLAAALSNNIIIADGSGNQRINVSSTGAVTIAQSLRVNGTFIVPTGANQRAGNAVLVAGTVTVANTSVTANTVIMLTRKTLGGVVGNTSYTVAAGVSFTINSSAVADTSTMSYFLIENP